MSSRRTLPAPSPGHSASLQAGNSEEKEPSSVSVAADVSAFEGKEPVLSSLVGQDIEKWRLTRLLGVGGMSVVYEAQHRWLAQQGALKLLRPEFAKHKETVRRFQQEAYTISRLEHPNIVEVQDYGIAPSHRAFMVLELLEGQDLTAFVGEAPLPLSWVLAVLKQLCGALSVVHNAGLIHRDLKPANVFLLPGQPHPRVKLLDFGVVKANNPEKLTAAGTIVGTPLYLSPEQIRSPNDLSPATDIYALGVLLYEALTGRLPLHHEEPSEHLLLVLQSTPPRIGRFRPEFTDSLLESLLARMLAKDPLERPASMGEVWREWEFAGAALLDPLDLPEHYPDVQGTVVPADLKEPVGLVDSRRVSHKAAIPTGAEILVAPSLEGGSPVKRRKTPVSRPQNQADSSSQRASVKNPTNGSIEWPPPHSWGRWKVGGILVLSLVALVWWTQLLVEPPPPQSNASVSRAPTSERGGLEKFVQQGNDAFQTKNYPKAAGLWQRVLQHPTWKDSPYFPNLYRALGSAYARQKDLFQGVAFYEKYERVLRARVQARKSLRTKMKRAPHAQQPGLKKQLVMLESKLPPKLQIQREFKEIRALRKLLQERRTLARQVLRTMKQHLLRNKWSAARLQVQQIRKLLPSGPEVYLEMAQLLEGKLPLVALSFVQASSSLAGLKPHHKAILQSKRVRLTRQIQRERQAFLGSLKELEAHLLKGRSSRVLQRFKANLPQGARQWLLFSDGTWRVWLTQQMKAHPKGALELWSLTLDLRRQREKDGLYRWFLMGTTKGSKPISLSQQKQHFKQCREILELWSKGEQSLRRGLLSRGLRYLKKAEARWAAFETSNPWGLAIAWRPTHVRWSREAQRIQGAMSLFQSSLRTFRQARFQRSLRWMKTLNKKLEGSVALPAMKRKMRRQQQLAQRAQQLLKQGTQALPRKRWRDVYCSYRAYLRLFPRAWNRKPLQQTLRDCQCAKKMLPWEKCKL